MKIEIDVPLRISIPSSKIPVTYQSLLALRSALNEEDRADETSMLNKLIEQLEVKLQWLLEREDRMRENEEWEKERRELIKQAVEEQQKQQQQPTQQQTEEPSAPSS